MNRKISLTATLLSVFFAVLITFGLTLGITLNVVDKSPVTQTDGSGTTTAPVTTAQPSFDADKIQSVIDRFDTTYVKDFDKSSITDDMLKALVASIGDPYCEYMTSKEYAEYVDSYTGDYVGIGVTVTSDDDGVGILVIEVVENSPAEEVGILSGDIIVAAGGIEVKKPDGTLRTIDEVANIIKGEEGTTVSVTVLRDGMRKTFTVERRAVVANSVRYKIYTAQDGTKAAKIHISSFDYTTPEQFKAAVDAAEAANVDIIIFDLRNNLGGLLSSVSAVMTYIFSGEVKIASARYKNYSVDIMSGKNVDNDYFEKNSYDNSLPQLFVSASGSIKYNEAYLNHEITIPMAVVINENSASASELFTAALRDYEKATVVGENSYGKGCMQVTYLLSDGSAIKLTSAYYDPPCGINFDFTTDGPIGIQPDVELVLTDTEKRRSVYTADLFSDRQLVAAFNAITKGEKLEMPTAPEE